MLDENFRTKARGSDSQEPEGVELTLKAETHRVRPVGLAQVRPWNAPEEDDPGTANRRSVGPNGSFGIQPEEVTCRSHIVLGTRSLGEMLQLRVYGEVPVMADVADQLDALPGTRHVSLTGRLAASA